MLKLEISSINKLSELDSKGYENKYRIFVEYLEIFNHRDYYKSEYCTTNFRIDTEMLMTLRCFVSHSDLVDISNNFIINDEMYNKIDGLSCVDRYKFYIGYYNSSINGTLKEFISNSFNFEKLSCSCGAKFTSNPNFHLEYCPLNQKNK